MACKEEEKEGLQRSKSSEDYCSSKTSKASNHEGSSPKKNDPKQFEEKLSDLLLTFHNLPLIPNETALNLLKIQSSK